MGFVYLLFTVSHREEDCFQALCGCNRPRLRQQMFSTVVGGGARADAHKVASRSSIFIDEDKIDKILEVSPKISYSTLDLVKIKASD